MKLTRRHFRRFGHHSLNFALRLFGCIVAVGVFAVVLKLEPSGWAVVAVIAIYGIYAVTEAIKTLKPEIWVTTVTKPEQMDVHGGDFHLVTRDLEAAVDRLIEKSEQKRRNPQ